MMHLFLTQYVLQGRPWIHSPTGHQIWGPLRQEGVLLNFALTVSLPNFCSAIRATSGQRQFRQSPGLAL